MGQINHKQICGVIWVISGCIQDYLFFGPNPYVALAVYEVTVMKIYKFW